jgi:poly(hydroxyalkanoate) depolymerase family esterase
MAPIDWRTLYAQNRAAIERSGVSLPHVSTPTATVLPRRRLHGVHAPLRPPLGRAVALPGVDAPGEQRTFDVGGRTRRALVYAPPGIGVETPAPLICMLHGCTQDPASFAAATRITAAADRHGFVVLLPGQDRADNAMGCWNWFERQHQRRDGGEPAAIAAMVEEMLGEAERRIDGRRVFVCGLSSGGAMASILAATYPDVFAAAAIHSGLAYGAASDVGSAYAAMARGGPDPAGQGRAAHAAMGRHARAVPTIVIHGQADRTVAAVNGHQALEQAMATNRLAATECRLLDRRRPATVSEERSDGGLASTRARWNDSRGALVHELLLVDGLGHAWSGGLAGGSYTDPCGPDATEAIARFFREASQRDPAPALVAGRGPQLPPLAQGEE